MEDGQKQVLEALSSDKPFEVSLDLEKTAPEAPEVAPVETVESAAPVTVTPPTAEKTVVLAKDGIHTLPFSVVEGLRARVAELSRQVEASAKAQSSPAATELPAIGEEDLQLLREEFPDAIKRMELLEAQLADKQKLEAQVAITEQERQLTAAEVAQAAIDSIPKLAHIQATDANLFAMACDLDAKLGEANPTMGLPERFQKAVDAIEVLYGPIAIEGGEVAPVVPAQSKPAVNIPAPKSPIPNSLTDLPAGSPPIHDPLAAFSAASTTSQLDFFSGKTPEEIHERLNQLT